MRGGGNISPQLNALRQEAIDAAAVQMVNACEAHLEPPYDDDIGKAYLELRGALRRADVVID